MIASLSNKHKVAYNGPNYIILSSATNHSNRSSANRSAHEPYASAQPERNDTDKAEPRMFKIRTFGGKAISAKQPRIEGRRMAQEAITCIKEDAQMRIIKCGYNNRRPSVQLSKQPMKEHSLRERKQAGSIDSSIFKEIQLRQKAERYQMSFQHIDFSEYSSLSHRPYVWTNNERPFQQNSPQVVIIFSLNIINLDPKKIFKLRQKSYYSQRSMEGDNQSPFTVEAQSILRNICGQSQKSFLNGCKVYFKVNGDPQMSDLREFLSSNQLKNYDGIIDVRGRYADTHHFYSIGQIVSEGQKLIVLEQQQTLRTEIPLVEDSEAMFITFAGKHLSYSNVNKTIKALKSCQAQLLKNSRNASTLMDSSKRDMSKFEDKENYHPNIIPKPLNRTKQSKFASNKKSSKKHSVLYLSTALKTSPFHFQWEIFNQKMVQLNGMKKIRQQLKESRNSLRQNILNPMSSLEKLQKPKSRNKSIEVQTSKQTKISVQLQGDFKDKLMKYVKILQSERNCRQPSKESRSRERAEGKEDDLEQLTATLTTRTKSKTPYQIVGDLIRNNMHIGRQVQKHLNKIAGVRKVLEKREQSLQEAARQWGGMCIYYYQQ